MSAYSDAGTSVKGMIESNKITKMLLSLDIIIMFASLALLLINSISGIGELLYAIAFWGFMIGVVLTFANLKNQMLYIGLFGYALANIIWFIRLLFTKYTGFGWYELIAIVIFGGLGYFVMRQE
jgi:hypothetical protein